MSATQGSYRVEGRDEGGIARRTLVQGAAWTVPVVALTAATPLAAASEALCPDISTSEGWVVRAPASGELINFGQGIAQWLAPDEYAVSVDNASAATGTAPTATITLERTFDVVAGTTYTFAYALRAKSGSLNSNDESWPVHLGANVGDQSRGDQTQYEIPVGPTLGGWHDRTLSFTPTESGPQTFRFTYTLWPRNGKPVNDDLHVRLPIITCAG